MKEKKEIRSILVGELTKGLADALKTNHVSMALEVFHVIVDSLVEGLANAMEGDYFAYDKLQKLGERFAQLEKENTQIKNNWEVEVKELKGRIEVEKAKYKTLEATNDKNYEIMTKWMNEKEQLEKNKAETTDLRASIDRLEKEKQSLKDQADRILEEKMKIEVKTDGILAAINASSGDGTKAFIPVDKPITASDIQRAAQEEIAEQIDKHHAEEFLSNQKGVPIELSPECQTLADKGLLPGVVKPKTSTLIGETFNISDQELREHKERIVEKARETKEKKKFFF